MGWRGDRGSYIVSPTPPDSPSGKGRPRGVAGLGPKGGEQGAGMGAFRVDRGSNVRGARLRIRSPFRKKEKEEARRSLIFAYEKEPLEKGARDDEVKEEMLLTEEYAAMIEKKEKKMGMVEETEVEDEESVMEDFERVCSDGKPGSVETERDDIGLRDDEEYGRDPLPLGSNTSAEEFGSYAVNHAGDHLNIVYEDCLPEDTSEAEKNSAKDDEAESVVSSGLSVETAREVAEAVIEAGHCGEEGEEEEEDLKVNVCEKQEEGWKEEEEGLEVNAKREEGLEGEEDKEEERESNCEASTNHHPHQNCRSRSPSLQNHLVDSPGHSHHQASQLDFMFSGNSSTGWGQWG